MNALVVGGGIAGIACAVRLAERGARVTVLETRKKLGGRATSFQDVRSGRWLDNCQHVVLGCCTNYLDLLGRLGVRDKIVWSREQHWIEEGGRTSVIKPGVLPAPAHFTGAFLRASFLMFSEKRAIASACSRILRTDREEWGGRTFADFLAACNQSERIIRRFWSPIVISACNLDVSRVAASSALQVFQQGFLANAHAADIGVPGVPLLDLYEGVERTLASGKQESAGGRIILGAGVEAIDERGATTTGGERYDADAVICALPVERVNRTVAPDIRARDQRFARLDEFTHSPILGVHLSFDRPVLTFPHAVLVDRPTQWLFRKDHRGQSIHAVISAADDWMPLSEEQIGEKVLADIHACIPDSQDAKLQSIRAVKEKLATFAPLPGTEALRPKAIGDSRIILAGDYTATGWPATMESATRSGYIAAAAALGESPDTLLAAPLRTATLARLAGLSR